MRQRLISSQSNPYPIRVGQAIKETVDGVQKKVAACSLAGQGAGAGLPECPRSLELEPTKTPWSTVFPLFGRLRRDASVEHLAGVRPRFGGPSLAEFHGFLPPAMVAPESDPRCLTVHWCSVWFSDSNCPALGFALCTPCLETRCAYRLSP